MKQVKTKIFVDDRRYVVGTWENPAPEHAAPWTVLLEDGLETTVLANGHFLSYSNLSDDDKSQLAILTYIEVCNEYDIQLLDVPDELYIVAGADAD
jgi:hypothetical protein